MTKENALELELIYEEISYRDESYYLAFRLQRASKKCYRLFSEDLNTCDEYSTKAEAVKVIQNYANMTGRQIRPREREKIYINKARTFGATVSDMTGSNQDYIDVNWTNEPEDIVMYSKTELDHITVRGFSRFYSRKEAKEYIDNLAASAIIL